jgi:hypothetical protein
MMAAMRALALLALACAPAYADWRPFVFSLDGQTLRAREGAIESGLGYNGLTDSKTAQLSDERSIDGWLRAAVGVTDRVELAGELSLGEVPGRGFGLGDGRAELRVRVLDPRPRFPVAVALSAGYQTDPRLHNAIESTAAISTEIGRFALVFNLRAAHYFAGGRDPIDVWVTAGASVRATSWLRAGVEYVGEELEGAFDAEEADIGRGGRHYVGPSTAVLLLDGRLRLNATVGAVLASAGTAPLARGSVAYRF